MPFLWDAKINYAQCIMTNRRSLLGYKAISVPPGLTLAQVFATAASSNSTPGVPEGTPYPFDANVRAKWPTPKAAYDDIVAALGYQPTVSGPAPAAEDFVRPLSYTRVVAYVRQSLGLPMDD